MRGYLAVWESGDSGADFFPEMSQKGFLSVALWEGGIYCVFTFCQRLLMSALSFPFQCFGIRMSRHQRYGESDSVD